MSDFEREWPNRVLEQSSPGMSERRIWVQPSDTTRWQTIAMVAMALAAFGAGVMVGLQWAANWGL